MATVFPGIFALGAAALALWFDARWESRRPESPSRRVGHAVAALGLLQVASLVASSWAADAPTALRMATLFAVLLPAWVYLFLVCAWLARTLADVASLRRG